MYIQSLIKLNWDFYIQPPHELESQLGIRKNLILKVIKPLYSVPEVGNYWLITYYNYYIKELDMNLLIYNPYFL